MSTCNDLSSCKHDVFISFRGDDTRDNFTSHLYAALDRKKIQVYKDDVSLPKGDEISPALRKAIEHSKISIVVLSENYATSRWCLDELVHILNCKKEKHQVVLPVFYKVDPSYVRKQQGSYAKAFVDHEMRFKDDNGKVLLWRSALEEAGNLSGWNSHDQSEYELVEKIAQVTLFRLFTIIPANIGGEQQSTLVGIEKRVDKIVSMLRFNSTDVRIIGIWGMGGIGKTTLAIVVQKQFSSKFESCFSVDVGNKVRSVGLPHLVNEFSDKLLKEKDVDMNNFMNDTRLQRTKMFVVLDNVDDLEHLKCLVGEFELIKSRFGEGSRIILTSRDRKLLQEVADDIYKVEALDFDKALQLFYRNAFRKDSSKIIEFIEQSKKVVDYSGGNPLALKVLGSYLHLRSIKEWESALTQLKQDEKVQKVLRISFDALDRVKQSLFLDIGCFFKKYYRSEVEEILGEESHIGINVLVENCLITIDEFGRIMMHDLIQEMVWEIVRQDSVTRRQSSRLFDTQDSCFILEKNKGTAINEGIFLDTSKMSKDLYLQPTVFEAMENLRIIQIDDNSYYFDKKKSKFKIHFDQGLQGLPDSLIYLCWEKYPLESLPQKFEPQNLVRLIMRESKLKKLWDGNVRLDNLKYIDLCYSIELIELPDLDQAPKLEYLNLGNCERLHRMPNINGNLKYLDIDFSGIAEFHTSLSDLLGDLVFKEMSKLKHLDLSGFKNLKSLTDFPSSLQHLEVSLCSSLKVIRGCTSLKNVQATGCESLTKFIIDEHGSQSWEELDLSFLLETLLPNLCFSGCMKLEQSAKENILNIFQRVVFGLATSPHEMIIEGYNAREYSVVYPGNEIPKWMIGHQEESDSIVVEFHHHHYTLDGFVVSAILELDRSPVGLIYIYWNVCFKTRSGITHKERGKNLIGLYEIDTPHVYMWYIKDYFTKELEDDDVVEATFGFCIFDDHDMDSDMGEIKRCGIQIIYQEEAEEFFNRRR